MPKRRGSRFEPVTRIAAADTGLIEGKVTDERRQAARWRGHLRARRHHRLRRFRQAGQFALKQLPPGPYLVRVHLAGFLAARSTMVNVRPSARSASSFTLRREGDADAPRVTEASVAAIGAAAPATEKRRARRERAGWRLRHLKRGVLRDVATPSPASRRTMTGSSPIRSSSSAARSGTSARAAKSLFSDISLGGQVNLLTTGAFDNPLQLLQLDRTSSVAFFSVGAPVGSHGDWNVRAAMNQSDLSSWMLAGSYVVKAQVPHRYQLGMVVQPAAL